MVRTFLITPSVVQVTHCGVAYLGQWAGLAEYGWTLTPAEPVIPDKMPGDMADKIRKEQKARHDQGYFERIPGFVPKTSRRALRAFRA